MSRPHGINPLGSNLASKTHVTVAWWNRKITGSGWWTQLIVGRIWYTGTCRYSATSLDHVHCQIAGRLGVRTRIGSVRRRLQQKKKKRKDGWSPVNEASPSHQVSSETSKARWSVALFFSNQFPYVYCLSESQGLCMYCLNLSLCWCWNSDGFCWIGVRW